MANSNTELTISITATGYPRSKTIQWVSKYFNISVDAAVRKCRAVPIEIITTSDVEQVLYFYDIFTDIGATATYVDQNGVSYDFPIPEEKFQPVYSNSYETVKQNNNSPDQPQYEESFIPARQSQSQSHEEPKRDVVCCPRCKSTAITTGPRGIDGFWGFIGASKTVNRCAKCGHMWTPRR